MVAARGAGLRLWDAVILLCGTGTGAGGGGPGWGGTRGTGLVPCGMLCDRAIGG